MYGYFSLEGCVGGVMLYIPNHHSGCLKVSFYAFYRHRFYALCLIYYIHSGINIVVGGKVAEAKIKKPLTPILKSRAKVRYDTT